MLLADIALERRYEEFIKRQLDDGRFDTASEVIQAGLEMLEDFENAQERWLTEAIPARLVEIEADPSVGIAADEVFARLETLHHARMAKTRK